MKNENRAVRRSMMALLIVCLMLAIGMWWWRNVNVMPVVKFPTVKMPKPNAYDNYAAGARAMPDIEKVYYALESAGKKPAGGHLYTKSEINALVRKNQTALKRFREGFAFEYRFVPPRMNGGNWPDYPRLRQLAHVLSLEGKAKELNGDWGGAMASYLDVIRLGEDIPRGGDIMALLVGTSLQNIGRMDAWKSVDRLDAAEAQAAAHRMEQMASKRVSLEDILRETKWGSQAETLDMLKDRRWRASLRRIPVSRSSSKTDELRMLFWTLTCSKRDVVDCHARFFDAAIADAQYPYSAQPHVLPQDPISLGLAQIYQIATFRYVASFQTQNDLLMVTLALRAYRVEHGRYPLTLAELTPVYLKRVPDDMFVAKGTLGYRLNGSKYVLYSVGPDGNDDGGKPAFNKRSHYTHEVCEGSKGDIVAGINK